MVCSIQNRTAFETTRKPFTIIFDKTECHPAPRSGKVIPSTDEKMKRIRAVQQIEHHIAKRIMAILKENGLALWKSEYFSHMQGIVPKVLSAKNGSCNKLFQRNRLFLTEIAAKPTRKWKRSILPPESSNRHHHLADSIRRVPDSAIDELKKHIKSFCSPGTMMILLLRWPKIRNGRLSTNRCPITSRKR